MSLRARLGSVTPWLAAEWFAAANLAFLAVDIGMAHSENGFARKAEWVPIVFSAAAPLALLPGLLRARWRQPLVGAVVGVCAIAVGLAGMLFHLESAFFETQTLHALVYTAPFVAPLAYVGLGLLLLLDRMESAEAPAWGTWVLLLALGGAAGNLGLSLLDHAQNGFFSALEWVPVVASAFGVSFLAVAMLQPNASVLRACLAVLGLQAAVGVVGFVFHALSDLHRPGGGLWERVIHGAPVFAPLLFADIAVLGALGIWGLMRYPAAEAGAQRAPTT